MKNIIDGMHAVTKRSILDETLSANRNKNKTNSSLSLKVFLSSLKSHLKTPMSLPLSSPFSWTLDLSLHFPIPPKTSPIISAG